MNNEELLKKTVKTEAEKITQEKERNGYDKNN